MYNTKYRTKKNFIVIFFFLFIFLLNISGKSKIIGIAERSILEILDKNVSLELQKIKIDLGIKKKIEKKFRQRFFKSWLYYWTIKNGHEITAFALLDNVYGKTSPITFITVFSKTGDIIGCRIVKYRESHGYEVKNKKWLENFKGKNASSLFKKDRDIDGISGATISSGSIIKGNGKLALLINYMIGKRNKS